MAHAFRITADCLAADGACAEQVELVRRMFGDGPIPCTVRNLRRGLKAGASIFWLERYIPVGAKAKYEADYAPILAKYDADHAPIRAKFAADYAPIRAKYEADLAGIWAKYEADQAPILAKYEADRAPIWAKYEADRVPILARALRVKERPK